MTTREQVTFDVSESRSSSAIDHCRRKRVLVVTFDFPPNRTSAVYRMVGLTSSLPQCGWHPTVLTIDGGVFVQEPDLLEKLPSEVEIVRTKFLRIGAWENKTSDAIRRVGGLRNPDITTGPRKIDGLLRSFAELVRSTLYFPDDTVGWVPYALSKAIELHRRKRFDLVYASTPPRSSAVIGLMLKLLCGVPLVTEFMDPWYPPTRLIRKSAEEWLQMLLLRKSDRVVVMLRQHAEEFARTYQISLEKLAVVRNGFFEDDFSQIERTEPNHLDPRYFHLTHFGTIYPGNQATLFAAMAQVLREKPEFKSRIRLHLVGFPCEDVVRYANESELKEITEYHGFLPRREDTLQMMRASDCLLLCWGRSDFSRLAIAGKTYDYLRAGRPILAVTDPQGGVAELVRLGEAGWVLPPNDIDAAKQVLVQVLSCLRKKTATGPVRPEYVAQFRWDRLAEQLARAFDEAVLHAG